MNTNPPSYTESYYESHEDYLHDNSPETNMERKISDYLDEEQHIYYTEYLEHLQELEEKEQYEAGDDY